MNKIFSFFAIMSTVFTFPAQANDFDFSNYTPTLDNTYSDGTTNINSRYTLQFTAGSSSDYDFIYDGVHYKVNTGVNSDKNGIDLPRQNAATGDLEGYFYELGDNSAIYNSNLGKVIADFIGNTGFQTGCGNCAEGGAIYQSSFDSITGDFIGNKAHLYMDFMPLETYGWGGAILGFNKSINTITGNFIANSTMIESVIGGAVTSGGAISMETSTINSIEGNFIGNSSVSRGTQQDENSGYSAIISQGGAISSAYNSYIGSITGNFIGNYTTSSGNGWEVFAYGGAIYNGLSTIGTISGSFIDNFSKADGTTNITGTNLPHAAGGAIYTTSSLTFEANGVNNIFTRNYSEDQIRGKLHNAIFLADSTVQTLTFNTFNSGTFIFDDQIETANSSSGGNIDYSISHDIVLSGDGTGSVIFNNDLINIGNITVSDSTLIFGKGPYGIGRILPKLNADGTADTMSASVTNMSLTNGTLDINNGYTETVLLSGYKALGTSYMHIDVEPNYMTSDVLSVNGDVSGTTNLVVHAASNEDIRGMGEILFAQSTNDTIGSASSFSLFRVYGSPFLYDIIYADLGSNSHTWSLAMNGSNNPDYVNGGGISVASEIVGYIGLHSASVEQTRSMLMNVRNKVAQGKSYCPGCGIYDIAYDGIPLYNAWISPVYHTASINKPQDMEADVTGVEGGFDIQYDAHNKVGVFASYRKGNYDFSGKGTNYYSPLKSEIDIDSYIGGLYYRYDKDNFWTFASVYGGIQQADLRTKDGIRTDTDGTQMGGSVDMGYLFPLKNRLTLEPNAGVSYTRIDFDNITDKYGKTAKYSVLDYIEATLGLKLEKTVNTNGSLAKVYIEPSIIRSFVNGDNVNISGIGKTETYNTGTFGRIELGGRYGIDRQLSIFASTNYTFGSAYDAFSINAGINYAW